MKKGFKSWCENYSLDIRKKLEIKNYEPLPYSALAEDMGVVIVNALELPMNKEIKNQLFKKDKRSWSALSIDANGKPIIIYNPTMSGPRIVSSIMHELAHLICGHTESKFITLRDTGLVIRTFLKEQEDEADWLSGCLLLPRESLVYSLKKNMALSEIQQLHGISKELLTYRINMTGVRRQLKMTKVKY